MTSRVATGVPPLEPRESTVIAPSARNPCGTLHEMHATPPATHYSRPAMITPTRGPSPLPWLTTLLPLLALAACDDSSSGKGGAAAAASSAPTASATPPPAASPPPTASQATSVAAPSSSVPLPKCPPGLTGNAFPAYCIKLPATYKVGEARLTPKRGSVAYDTGSPTDSLMVSYDDAPLAQAAKDTESEMKFGQDKLEKKGDLPNGNKWFQGTHEDFARIVTLYKTPGLTVKCSFAYKPAKAPPQEAIDACKSIVFP